MIDYSSQNQGAISKMQNSYNSGASYGGAYTSQNRPPQVGILNNTMKPQV